MSKGKFLFFMTATCLATVGGIVSKGGAEETAADNIPAQSIDRDYVAGYDDGYGHRYGHGYGLSAYADYGSGHEGYGVHEDNKHVHHLEDHHHHHHHHGHHKHHDYHKALAIKGLLVPLAGVALLGAAAAFVSNPILLQLGVISGTALGRRKRDADPPKPGISLRLNEIKLLERFMAQVPRREVRVREKKMLAEYLSCSGAGAGGRCLERLACELHSGEGRSMPVEADVLTIVVNKILGNDYVPEETKRRLSEAVDRGRKDSGCGVYKCDEIEAQGRRS